MSVYLLSSGNMKLCLSFIVKIWFHLKGYWVFHFTLDIIRRIFDMAVEIVARVFALLAAEVVRERFRLKEKWEHLLLLFLNRHFVEHWNDWDAQWQRFWLVTVAVIERSCQVINYSLYFLISCPFCNGIMQRLDWLIVCFRQLVVDCKMINSRECCIPESKTIESFWDGRLRFLVL